MALVSGALVLCDYSSKKKGVQRGIGIGKYGTARLVDEPTTRGAKKKRSCMLGKIDFFTVYSTRLTRDSCSNESCYALDSAPNTTLASRE